MNSHFIYHKQFRLLQHMLFWAVSFYILLQFFASSNKLLKVDIIYTIVFHVTLAIPVYLNLYLLIPTFLNRDKYLTYSGLLLLLLGAGTALNLAMFEYLIDFIFPGYYFISYYEFWDILKFFVVYIGITSLFKLSKAWFRLTGTENEKLVFELKVLKSQINPHFLFNSLTGIYALARKKSGRAPDTILKLAEMMRYMLYDAENEWVPLEQELSFIRNYFELQQLRTNAGADIKVNISGNGDDLKIAPLLFTPLIENSFKHGLMGDAESAFVHLNIQVTDKELTLSLSNNKGKSDNIERNMPGGIGIDNVKKRLVLIYANRHSFEIDEKENTFKAILKIRLYS